MFPATHNTFILYFAIHLNYFKHPDLMSLTRALNIHQLTIWTAYQNLWHVSRRNTPFHTWLWSSKLAWFIAFLQCNTLFWQKEKKAILWHKTFAITTQGNIKITNRLRQLILLKKQLFLDVPILCLHFLTLIIPLAISHLCYMVSSIASLWK